MWRSGKARPEDSGPGVYRFLVADAILGIREAAISPHAWIYHTAVQHLMDLIEPIVRDAKFAPTWKKEMAAIMVNEKGELLKPGDEMSREQRHAQVGVAMLLLRKAGVFDAKEKPFDQATDFFKDHEAESAEDEESVEVAM